MVPAAGSGTRLGHTEPKAFVQVDGRTLLAHSLDAIITSGVATTIVVAAPEGCVSLAEAEVAEVRRRFSGGGGSGGAGLGCSADADGVAGSDAGAHGGAGVHENRVPPEAIEIIVVPGGADRVASVEAALAAAGDPDIVLVHDAARALTPPSVFDRVTAAVASGAEAVVPVLPMIDTVRRAEESPRRIPLDDDADLEPDPPREQPIPPQEHAAEVEVLRGDLDRGSLRRVQTPQGFTAETLRRAHASYREEVRTLGAGAREATDDAGLVERLGVDVVAVPGDEESLKITYPLDLVLAEHIARERGRAHPASV
ncbi:2-C-methyl-D-erythritol 4-phosphate cytidylyltransferase [Brevibacterium sp. NPDC056947]|uniref:IspD/TarI family cytidylyltransferase n=1 Tax=Brevibacterium sp. NPDC056947 TaxID=3345974 RepID=UPI00362C8B45